MPEPTRTMLDLTLQSESHLSRRRHGRRQPESRDARTRGDPINQMGAGGVRTDGAEGERGAGSIAQVPGLRRRLGHLSALLAKLERYPTRWGLTPGNPVVGARARLGRRGGAARSRKKKICLSPGYYTGCYKWTMLSRLKH